MTPADYQKLIDDCRSQAELESLLTRWHEVKGTLAELSSLRVAWLARSLAIDEIVEQALQETELCHAL